MYGDSCPFYVLGVPKGCSLAVAKKQYHLKAKLVHPDKNPNDQEASARFQRLHNAFKSIEKQVKIYEGVPRSAANPFFRAAASAQSFQSFFSSTVPSANGPAAPTFQQAPPRNPKRGNAQPRPPRTDSYPIETYARQTYRPVPGDEKCARPGCQYYVNFHCNVREPVRGLYCCNMCHEDKGHGPVCTKNTPLIERLKKDYPGSWPYIFAGHSPGTWYCDICEKECNEGHFQSRPHLKAEREYAWQYLNWHESGRPAVAWWNYTRGPAHPNYVYTPTRPRDTDSGGFRPETYGTGAAASSMGGGRVDPLPRRHEEPTASASSPSSSQKQRPFKAPPQCMGASKLNAAETARNSAAPKKIAEASPMMAHESADISVNAAPRHPYPPPPPTYLIPVPPPYPTEPSASAPIEAESATLPQRGASSQEKAPSCFQPDGEKLEHKPQARCCPNVVESNPTSPASLGWSSFIRHAGCSSAASSHARTPPDGRPPKRVSMPPAPLFNAHSNSKARSSPPENQRTAALNPEDDWNAPPGSSTLSPEHVPSSPSHSSVTAPSESPFAEEKTPAVSSTPVRQESSNERSSANAALNGACDVSQSQASNDKERPSSPPIIRPDGRVIYEWQVGFSLPASAKTEQPFHSDGHNERRTAPNSKSFFSQPRASQPSASCPTPRHYPVPIKAPPRRAPSCLLVYDKNQFFPPIEVGEPVSDKFYPYPYDSHSDERLVPVMSIKERKKPYAIRFPDDPALKFPPPRPQQNPRPQVTSHPTAQSTPFSSSVPSCPIPQTDKRTAVLTQPGPSIPATQRVEQLPTKAKPPPLHASTLPQATQQPVADPSPGQPAVEIKAETTFTCPSTQSTSSATRQKPAPKTPAPRRGQPNLPPRPTAPPPNQPQAPGRQPGPLPKPPGSPPKRPEAPPNPPEEPAAPLRAQQSRPIPTPTKRCPPLPTNAHLTDQHAKSPPLPPSTNDATPKVVTSSPASCLPLEIPRPPVADPQKLRPVVATADAAPPPHASPEKRPPHIPPPSGRPPLPPPPPEVDLPSCTMTAEREPWKLATRCAGERQTLRPLLPPMAPSHAPQPATRRAYAHQAAPDEPYAAPAQSYAESRQPYAATAHLNATGNQADAASTGPPATSTPPFMANIQPYESTTTMEKFGTESLRGDYGEPIGASFRGIQCTAYATDTAGQEFPGHSEPVQHQAMFYDSTFNNRDPCVASYGQEVPSLAPMATQHALSHKAPSSSSNADVFREEPWSQPHCSAFSGDVNPAQRRPPPFSEYHAGGYYTNDATACSSQCALSPPIAPARTEASQEWNSHEAPWLWCSHSSVSPSLAVAESPNWYNNAGMTTAQDFDYSGPHQHNGCYTGFTSLAYLSQSTVLPPELNTSSPEVTAESNSGMADFQQGAEAHRQGGNSDTWQGFHSFGSKNIGVMTFGSAGAAWNWLTPGA